MKSNQLRGELKDVETLFKDAYEDFDSNFMNRELLGKQLTEHRCRGLSTTTIWAVPAHYCY